MRVAVDGLSALWQIEQRIPDVVVLDLDLPRMNGIAVHEELHGRERTHHVPVIIVTGMEWESPFPVYATFRKPITPDELVRVVSGAASIRTKSQPPQPTTRPAAALRPGS